MKNNNKVKVKVMAWEDGRGSSKGKVTGCTQRYENREEAEEEEEANCNGRAPN
eukprot:CAMPEP_0194766842 /NCGR_PEP_ID=MMETSP0323_2-20130528/33463_1 /TAXON_ID=2866 ORGANISM="Crypthecodinium cohnii, Strain Seligo" /NCGR_SAMPLE_ID=MMETSP0323_2 /ASSEMBLY_ACC=CAM_ASM_000346 /LENGTH=52 /DNA_ID=CAMNT_0039698125 /DNA_START=86 /DNA_END=244 /DNA_ORIENTATION=-